MLGMDKKKPKEIDEIVGRLYAEYSRNGYDLADILRIIWLDGDAHARLSHKLVRQAKSRSVKQPRAPKKPKILETARGDWQRLRYRALQVAKGKCQCCGATAESSGHPLHVDHIKPKRKYPELAFEFSNLQVLCKACNFGKNEWDETDWREIVPEIKGI